MKQTFYLIFFFFSFIYVLSFVFASGAERSLCVTWKALKRFHIVANEWWMANQSKNPEHYVGSLFCCYHSYRDRKTGFRLHVWCTSLHIRWKRQMFKCSVQWYKVYKDHVVPIKYVLHFLKLILFIFHGNYDVNNMHNMLSSNQCHCFGVFEVLKVTFHNLRFGFFSWIQIFVY